MRMSSARQCTVPGTQLAGGGYQGRGNGGRGGTSKYVSREGSTAKMPTSEPNSAYRVKRPDITCVSGTASPKSSF